MRRIRFLMLEGAARAAAGPAALRHRHHRADPPADDARLRGDHRRQGRADRRRRRRSVAGEPRADRALRRVAELHDRRHACTTVARGRPVPRARRRVDGAGDSGRLRRAHRRPGRPATRAGRRRRHRRELDRRRAGLRAQPDRRLRPGARRASGAAAGRTCRRRHRRRASASGSTRSSRAATS